LAVDYESDLGAKSVWFSSGKITMLDGARMVYASMAVSPKIDAMLAHVAQMSNLAIHFPISR